MNGSTDSATHADLASAEARQRVDLAAAYQLAEHFGWTELIWNHISARVPGRPDRFLINPLGYMYDEITASTLVTVDLDGTLVAGEGQTSPAGFVIHSAVHRVRHDVDCVMHSHTPEAVAVSCLRDGIPQLCGETAFFYDDIAYHDYEGVSLNLDERDRIAANLGSRNFLVLRNHGLLTCGRNVGEAFMRMYYLIYSCRVLQHLLAMGRPFSELSDSLAQLTHEQDLDGSAPAVHEWDALKRRLDRIAPHYRN